MMTKDQGENVLRGNGRCKGPEATVSLECSNNLKKGTWLKQCEQGVVEGAKVGGVSHHEEPQRQK